MRGLNATTKLSIVETAWPIHATTRSIIETREMQPSKNFENYASPTDQKWSARRQRRIRSKMTTIQIRMERPVNRRTRSE